MILLCNNKSTTGANRAAVGFRGYSFVRDTDKPMFPSEDFGVISVCHLASTLGEAWRYVHATHGHLNRGNEPGRAAEGIDSPGEYKLASSLAPACCGPHLSAPRPGPCGSGFCVCAPQPSSSPILAISPLWARPLQSLYSQPGTNGIINFSADAHRSVGRPIRCGPLSAATNG